MKVTVIYPKGSLNEGNKKPHIRPEDTVMEIDLLPSDGIDIDSVKNHKDDLGLCELVWRAMNRVDGTTIERHLNKYQVRSMMVGDLVIINGKTYVCKDMGFALK